MIEPDDNPVDLPIDGVLDLHTFKPSEVKQLVPDFIEACWENGIIKLRIIHGKGTGTLMNIVHNILDKHPNVLRYWQEDSAGGWGATVVDLKDFS